MPDLDLIVRNARVATASDDFTARIWNAKTGTLEVEFIDRIALRADDDSVSWPVPPATLTRVGCERLRGFPEVYADARATKEIARHRVPRHRSTRVAFAPMAPSAQALRAVR